MLKKCLAMVISGIFAVQSVPVSAAGISWLPLPGVQVSGSPAFAPSLMQGLRVDRADPMHIQFLIEEGQVPLSQDETRRNLRYFLTGLTVPEKDIWVNLSPDEKNRIAPDVIARTEIGRELLAQDYFLKQLSSSMLFPEGEQGKIFWREIYIKAEEQFGTTDIAFDGRNKVWIMPGDVEVQERGSVAVISKAALKVMIDQDYMAAKNPAVAVSQDANQILMNKMFREIIIPGLEREVNTGSSFSRLRQIYHAMILAAWYKRRFNEGKIYKTYGDKGKLFGLATEDLNLRGQVWAQYVEAYKKGVFNFVKEDVDVAGGTVPRKYFSGGVTLGPDMAMSFTAVPMMENGPVFRGALRVLDVRGKDRAQVLDKYLTEDPQFMGNKGRNLQVVQLIFPDNVPKMVKISGELYADYHEGKTDLRLIADGISQKFSVFLENGGTLAVRPAGLINMPGILSTIKGVHSVENIEAALVKIYQEWEGPAVQAYLFTEPALQDLGKIQDKKFFTGMGPAIVVQEEVFSDRGPESASGVFVSRRQNTGEFFVSGTIGINTPPEDIRNGSVEQLKSVSSSIDGFFPSFKDKGGFYAQIEGIARQLEKTFKYPVEVEFLIERGKLWILQVNHQDLGPEAQQNAWKDLIDQGILTRTATVKARVQLIQRRMGRLRSDAVIQEVFSSNEGGFSPGAVDGILVFDIAAARQYRKEGKYVNFVAGNPEQNGFGQGLINAEFDGVITLFGGYHMHYARIARGRLIPGVSFAGGKAVIVNTSKGKALQIGGKMFYEGDRLVIIEEDIDSPDGMSHTVRLIEPRQEEAVVEMQNVNINNAGFDEKDVRAPVRRQFGRENYMVLTAVHALLKGYLVKLEENSMDADKLEIATNEIHEILDERFAALGEVPTELNGSREAVFFPIIQGFGANFPMPEIKTVADIQQVVDLMKGYVRRYETMFAEEMAYLNYDPVKRNIVAESDVIPVSFSVQFPDAVNWSYENAQLWAFVHKVSVGVLYKRMDMPESSFQGPAVENLRFNPDPFNEKAIRVSGTADILKSSPSKLFSLKFVDNRALEQKLLGKSLLQFDTKAYLLEVASFKGHMKHKMEEIKEKYRLLEQKEVGKSDLSLVTIKEELYQYFKPDYTNRGLMGSLKKSKQDGQYNEDIENDGRSSEEGFNIADGDIFWRFFNQSLGSYFVGEENRPGYIAEPDLFWPRESRLFAALIREELASQGVIHRAGINRVFDIALHNQRSLLNANYLSWMIMDEKTVTALGEEIVRLSQKYDLAPRVMNVGRAEEFDLEGLLLLSFMDHGKGEQDLLKFDKAEAAEKVGGIDLDLSNQKLGNGERSLSDPGSGEITPDFTNGFVPVIMTPRGILSVAEFTLP